MQNTIDQDITTIEHGLICHQVNCRGGFGKGLAKQIREKFPIAYEQYMTAHTEGRLRLGTLLYCPVRNDGTRQLVIAQLAGQASYWRYGQTRKNHTSYDHYPEMLKGVSAYAAEYDLPVYIPHGLGCGLAGGNWEVMQALIAHYLPKATLVIFRQKISE